MLVVGTNVAVGKLKVDGAYVDGSQTVQIVAANPPNPPEPQVGKDAVLYLNTQTNELFWDFVDRPFTNSEEVERLKAENAALNQQLATANGNFNGFVDQYYIDNPELA